MERATVRQRLAPQRGCPAGDPALTAHRGGTAAYARWFVQVRAAIRFLIDLRDRVSLLCQLRLRRRRARSGLSVLRTLCGQDVRAPSLTNRAAASLAGNRGINLHARFSSDEAALNSRMVKVTNSYCERVRGVVWFRDRRQ